MPLDLPHQWRLFPRRLRHRLLGPLATEHASVPRRETLQQLPLRSRKSRR
jgi:hypothetical protein